MELDVRFKEPAGEPEWPLNLDVEELLEQGWRPTPFRQFVLKIHSRCNLACSYCYMYEMADQGWLRQPRRMARPTIDAVAARIAEHVSDNGLKRVELILHGGEPLLAGADHVRYAVTTIRSAVPSDVTTDVRVQTNGILLDPVFLELFDELGVFVSVSLDGDREANDRHRLSPNGQSSHERVLAGLARLNEPRYRHLFSGILCAIDVQNAPVRTYESLLAHRPPAMDLLLPHGTWDTPPPGRKPDSEETPYADWLIQVFDRWYRAPVQETQIRLFTEIIRLLLGQPSRSESVGLSAVATAVVETDGGIEQVDSLKSAYDGATATSLHVSRDSFDAALLLPPIAARQIGARALAPPCTSCDLRRVCGAGLYPHRYRSGTGFANPSVYCRDLYRLIDHIRLTLAGDVADMLKRKRAANDLRALPGHALEKGDDRT
ncbi:FxsB family cyclophane-forming radical SAM/SPASM peptide maturase [Actinomadura sp. B10D3]|uniref:FxsB family cyclophane-forming radical SAM/SPASM peptide maturase n=1 Tax=Actinomadura sp. B10D3 TaxID=3153557 RepID=UPI00325EBCFB